MDTAESYADPNWEEFDLLSELPFDIQHVLFTHYLGPETMSRLSCINSQMRDFCSAEEFWKKFCCDELGIKLKDMEICYKHTIAPRTAKQKIIRHDSSSTNFVLTRGSPMTFYEMYTQLIYPFRGLLNRILTSDTSTYGDILTISFEAGLIRGTTWFVPADITNPMVALTDFTIFIFEGINSFIVRNEFLESSIFETDMMLKDLISAESRSTVRPPKSVHFLFRTHPYSWRTRLKMQENIVVHDITWPHTGRITRPEWVNMQFGEEYTYGKLWDLMDGKETTPSTGAANSRSFQVLPSLKPSSCLPRVSPELGLPEGIFKGTYGANGNQLVWMWSFNGSDLGRKITGWKITGDSFVAAGKATFSFDVSHAVIVGCDQQNNIEHLEGLSDGPFIPNDNPARLRQSFQIPHELLQLGDFDGRLIGDVCTARFVGRGKIKTRQLFEPKYVVTHLIVLSPSRFLVLWLGSARATAFFEKVALDDPFHKFAVW